MDFSNKEIDIIKTVIETGDKEEYDVAVSFHTIWFQSRSSDAELRVGFLGDRELIVSRIAVSHKRKGVATEILNLLVEICKKKNVHRVVMQSVLTPERAAFCEKYGFHPNPMCSINLGEFTSGDWVLDIE